MNNSDYPENSIKKEMSPSETSSEARDNQEINNQVENSETIPNYQSGDDGDISQIQDLKADSSNSPDQEKVVDNSKSDFSDDSVEKEPIEESVESISSAENVLEPDDWRDDSEAFADEEDLFSENIQDLEKDKNTASQKPKRKSKLKEYAFMSKNSKDNYNDDTYVDEGKNKKKVLIALGIIGALLLFTYIGGAIFYQNRFLPNTYVNGANISSMDLAQAQQAVSEMPLERSVEIIGRDGVKSEVKASDVGYTLTETPDLESDLKNQNAFTWPLHLLKNYSQNIDNASSINDEALTNVVANLEIVAGPQVVKTENARAEYNGTEFVVRPEVFGTEVDVPKLIENVRQSLVTGKAMINLEEEENYVMPVTLEDSEVLAQSIQQLNSITGAAITYDFKASQEIVDKNTFLPWLGTSETGEAVVNPDMVSAYVASLAEKYDTVGKKVNFTTSSGTPIEVTDWAVDGWQINQPQEVADLSNLILTGQTVTKEPAYNSTGRDRAINNTISGTYLEISLSDQEMWYYQNGQLVVNTPVVTGDPTAGHGTPEGLFDIQDKEMNVVLRGPGYASPVTFWIPFDGGIGVHDSSWRGSYGGSIYWGNGSHGCVNTPYSAVRTIYNTAEVGQPVVVY